MKLLGKKSLSLVENTLLLKASFYFMGEAITYHNAYLDVESYKMKS